MKTKIFGVLASAFLLNSFLAEAQTTTNKTPIVPSVPFLTISPDSRGAALGDAGVASGPDAYSLFWNTAKLAFLEKNVGASLSYNPWLRDLVDDMALMNVSFYKKAAKSQALGFGLTYFNQGEIDFRTNTGSEAGKFNSREFSFTGGYTRKIARDMSMGLNLKFIHSNLIGNYAVNNQVSKPANTVAGDISFFYMKDLLGNVPRKRDFLFGVVLSNLGGKINYGRSEYFLPTTLKVGTNLRLNPDEHNQFNILLDANKLLVPSNNLIGTGAIQGVFESFSTLGSISGSLGVEYLYDKTFAARLGYFMESGVWGRKYGTMGLGMKFKEGYGLDLSYLIPTTQGSPLANTWRISLVFDLDAKKVSNPTEDTPTE